MTRHTAQWRLIPLILMVACTGPTEGSIPTTTTVTTPSAPTSATTGPTTTTATAGVSDTLLVVGDWGSGTSDQAEVAAQMETVAAESQVDAILTTGDNFYMDDAATLLAPYQWAVDSGIDFWITWGNHDIESPSRIEAVNDSFGDPPRWTTRTWGETEIIILDSNQVDSEEQLRFLEEEMGRIDAPTIVVSHHPAFSCASHDDTESIFYGWIPQFDDDVVLVLSGHAHSFQRFEVDGVPYVVTGGGGAGLQPLDACAVGHPPRVVGVEAHHFLTITQDPSELVVTAIDEDGNEIDRFTVAFRR